MVYVKILKIFKKKLQKDSSIILFLQAYFFLYVQPKKYLAIAIIQDLMNYRLTTKEEFILINLKILSEVRIRSELTKQDILLNEFVQYESLKTSFSQKVLMMSKYKVKFWQNLSSDQPNFRNLDRASSEMNKLKVNIKDLFISLDKIKSMSMESLQKYAVYLQEVECNYIEAAKIFEKLSYMLKKKRSKRFISTPKSDNSAIIIVDGNLKNNGNIINVNDATANLFGHRQKKLLDNPIENFMPEFFGQRHTSFIKKFYKRGEGVKVGYISNIFILNQENFLKMVSMQMRMLPSLDEGIHFLGVLKPSSLMSVRGKSSEYSKNRERACYLIAFEKESGQIVYSCENSFKYLGIVNSHKQDTSKYKKLNMKAMCPHFYEEESESKLENGTEMILKTRSLQEDIFKDEIQAFDKSESFQLGNDNEAVEGYEEDEDEVYTQMKTKRKKQIKIQDNEIIMPMNEGNEEDDIIQQQLNKLYGTFNIVGQVVDKYDFSPSQTFIFFKFLIKQNKKKTSSDGITAINSTNMDFASVFMTLNISKTELDDKPSTNNFNFFGGGGFTSMNNIANDNENVYNSNNQQIEEGLVVDENMNDLKIQTKTGLKRERAKQRSSKQLRYLKKLLAKTENSVIDRDVETKHR